MNRASSACKHRVSGSLSLPSRGAFHLSLTVLSAIGRQGVFSLGKWSSLIPTRFHVSHGTYGLIHAPLLFAYETVTPFGCPFQSIRLSKVRMVSCRNNSYKPSNPGKTTLAGLYILPV